MTQNDSLIQFLRSIHQEQLIRELDQHPSLSAQLANYRQRPTQELLYHPLATYQTTFEPPHTLYPPTANAQKCGEQALMMNQVHAICLAAGTGSRLNFSKPKALFPILKDETLLDIQLNSLKDDQTISYLCSQMGSSAIQDKLPSHFPPVLTQTSLPYFNEKKEWIVENNQILEGPDGNGSLLLALKESNTLELLQAQGVEHIIPLPIDNPLLTPYDPYLIGNHILHGAQITIKCFKRETSDQKVGAIGLSDNKTCIVDYHHLKDERLNYANTNHIVIRIDWLMQHLKALPIHWVPKTIHCGKIYKGERFITDLIQDADKVALHVEKKEECFAPLKTQDDVTHLQKLLAHRSK